MWGGRDSAIALGQGAEERQTLEEEVFVVIVVLVLTDIIISNEARKLSSLDDRPPGMISLRSTRSGKYISMGQSHIRNKKVQIRFYNIMSTRAHNFAFQRQHYCITEAGALIDSQLPPKYNSLYSRKN